jgi:hypothetical protein
MQEVGGERDFADLPSMCFGSLSNPWIDPARRFMDNSHPRDFTFSAAAGLS